MKKRFFEKNIFLNYGQQMVVVLGAHKSLSYWWNFGSFLGIILGLQIFSGLFLSFSFLPEESLAFFSVDFLSRESKGWILRVLHLNGASLMFFFLFLHMSKGLKMASFRLIAPWTSGVLLFFTTMIIAFLGYVLPWGQMSFWGATVITNFLSALPWIGQTIVLWVWGGYSICQATLGLFFTLHFFLPFILLGVAGGHLLVLHESGSSSPLRHHGSESKSDFYPAFVSKDSENLIFLVLCYGSFFLFPYFLGDPENFIAANPSTSPLHIQPEWYFLFAYAILRSIPNKLGGVIALMGSVCILFLLPLKQTPQPPRKHSFSLVCLAAIFFLLTWVGGQAVETPFIELGGVCSLFYFLLFLWLSYYWGFFLVWS